MPVEGRSLSSRRTQEAARDLEIGRPIHSAECSETADGVARESEGRSRLSLLRPLRQDQPRRHSGACLCPVPLQQGRTGRGWSGLRGHRCVWGAAMAGRTGACAQAGDLPTGPYQTRVHTEGQRQTQAAGHLNLAGSSLHDSSDAGAGNDLRGRPSTGTLRLPSRAKRPGWRETKTLKPIDNVFRGEATSHRAVTTVNAKVASKVSTPDEFSSPFPQRSLPQPLCRRSLRWFGP